MRMCTVATTPPFNAHAHRCNAAVLAASNCRETVANYTSSKGVSMETVETPLYPPLLSLFSSFPPFSSPDFHPFSPPPPLIPSRQHLQQKQLMVEHLVKLVTEKGLDSQNYKCCGCNRDIGLSMLGGGGGGGGGGNRDIGLSMLGEEGR